MGEYKNLYTISFCGAKIFFLVEMVVNGKLHGEDVFENRKSQPCIISEIMNTIKCHNFLK